ncbi:MAG: ATP:cob(I)alamin adenosyltransferase, partial [Thiohalomonadales bacterium]
ATCHQARAICRRAERHLVRLQQTTPINPNVSTFINRLSDFLFVLSRYINQSQQVADFVWKSEKTT